MLKKMKVSVACSVVLGLSFATVGIAAPASAMTSIAPATQVEAHFASPASLASQANGSSMTNEEFDALVKTLEALPEDLKNADPLTTPDYNKKLSQALSDVSREQKLEGLALGVALPAVNYLACGYEAVLLVAQYGIPIGKIIGWFREAKAIFKSVSGIWSAIRSGQFLAQMGPEAAELVKAALGLNGIVAACF